MVLHVCGEPISVPTYISKWAEENEDNKIELQGMVEAIVWAAKKSIAEDVIEDNTKKYSEGMNEFLSAYNDFLKALMPDTDKKADDTDNDKNKGTTN